MYTMYTINTINLIELIESTNCISHHNENAMTFHLKYFNSVFDYIVKFLIRFK